MDTNDITEKEVKRMFAEALQKLVKITVPIDWVLVMPGGNDYFCSVHQPDNGNFISQGLVDPSIQSVFVQSVQEDDRIVHLNKRIFLTDR